MTNILFLIIFKPSTGKFLNIFLIKFNLNI